MSSDEPKSDPSSVWEDAYAGGDADRSWTQLEPVDSLKAIAVALPEPADPVIDVGGGASTLAGRLLADGFSDITVLDLSSSALQLAQRRLGKSAERIVWVQGDLLDSVPEREYGFWHDRAVLHFFTDPVQRSRYAELLARRVRPGGHAAISTFAPDGPDRCSGLPVRRSSHEDLENLLGDAFENVATWTTSHQTPRGTPQPFNWIVARRRTN
ncbi:class I SAM-dependent methyltransferase [Paraconexibacter algicola]|uniref:class I SAM-dependent methyltransferase n=1 Tax=Paraconexibacter algicola TaxID=2133960 RepID=UPI001304DFD9|nr:class I SAM-dependent methyltransferase [Paraconexibacter algicola]